MRRFVPNKGLLFYVFCRPFERILAGEHQGPNIVVKQANNSYRGQVFECIATDDTYIVGKPVHGGFSDKPIMFAQCDVDFAPVGPEILATLAINTK